MTNSLNTRCRVCGDRAILTVLASGATRHEIADELFMSESNVAFRIRVMCAQLRVATSTALVAKAYAAGILQAHEWPPRRCTSPMFF